MHDALNVINGIKDLDVYIEQPCISYNENLSVRKNTNKPFILDESINSVDSLLRAYHDKAMDIINIKISKIGGVSKTKMLRDLCLELGIAMTIEDS